MILLQWSILHVHLFGLYFSHCFSSFQWTCIGSLIIMPNSFILILQLYSQGRCWKYHVQSERCWNTGWCIQTLFLNHVFWYWNLVSIWKVFFNIFQIQLCLNILLLFVWIVVRDVPLEKIEILRRKDLKHNIELVYFSLFVFLFFCSLNGVFDVCFLRNLKW